MVTIKFHVNAQVVTYDCPGRIIVAGSKEVVYASFELDGDWTGLSATAFFENDFATGSFARVLTGEPVEVPPEVLVPGKLRVSVVGLGNGGNQFLPTKQMQNPIQVHRHGPVVGLTPEETTPELWQQVMALIGDPAELNTKDKSTLVAAINEALTKGGGSSGAVSYAEPQELSEEQQAQARENIGAQISDFVITFTAADGYNLTADKTWAETTEAYKAGRRLSGIFESREYVLDSFGEGEEAHFVHSSITELKETRIYFLSSGTGYYGVNNTYPIQFPVQSVNGKTGAVKLTADDVGALPKDTEIPSIPSALPNPYKLRLTGAVTAEYDGSGAVTVAIPEGGSDIEPDTTLTVEGQAADAKAVGDALAGKIPVPTTAEVGQIIQVSAVDDTGKPTAWEALDLPSGGGDEWELIADVTVEGADTSCVCFTEFQDGTPLRLKAVCVFADIYPALQEGSSPGVGCVVSVVESSADKRGSTYWEGWGARLTTPSTEGQHGWRQVVLTAADDNRIIPLNTMTSYNDGSMPRALTYTRSVSIYTSSGTVELAEPGVIDNIGVASYVASIGVGTQILVYGIRA